MENQGRVPGPKGTVGRTGGWVDVPPMPCAKGSASVGVYAHLCVSMCVYMCLYGCNLCVHLCVFPYLQKTLPMSNVPDLELSMFLSFLLSLFRWLYIGYKDED